MLMRHLFAFATLFALLAVAEPAAAQQPCRPQVRSASEIRERALHFGITPEQVTRVYAVIDCQRREIADQARRIGRSEQLLTNVVAEFALRNPNITPQQIVGAIRRQAEQVVTLTRALDTANARIADMGDAQVREPARAAMTRVRALLDAGDLDGANALFVEIEHALRRSVRYGYEATAAVVRARVQLAYARGDLDEGQRIAEAARMARAQSLGADEQALAERREFTRREDLASFIAESEALVDRGLFFADRQAFADGVRVLEERALPLGPRETALSDWADVQNRIGLSKQAYGHFINDRNMMAQAMQHFDNALAAEPRNGFYQNNAASYLIDVARREVGRTQIELLETARQRLSILYRTLDPATMPQLYWLVRRNLGEAMAMLGLFRRDPATLREAVGYLENQPDVNAGSPIGETYWAIGQFSLAQALAFLALVENDPGYADRALIAVDSTQQIFTLERAPAFWRRAQHLRSTIYFSRAAWDADPLPNMRAAEAALVELVANITAPDEAELLAVVTQSLGLVRRSITDAQEGRVVRR
jgi:tetratricopeptide (TPR) repeat protein